LAVAVLLPAFFVSCTKSGALTGSPTSSGFSANSMTGSVNGGLSSVANATVALMAAGSNVPLTNATTASDGSFSLVFNNPGGNNLLYLSITGGNAGGGTNSKNQFLAIAGTTSALLPSLRVNELTTAATEFIAFNFGILNDNNGSVALNAPGNGFGATNVVTQYNNIINSGALNTTNANLTSSAQTALKVLANAFASCIQSPSSCSTLLNVSISSASAAALSVLESGVNALYNSSLDASHIYPIASSLSSSTGFTLASSTIPNSFSFNNPLAATINTIGSGTTPQGLAVDASGNIWVTNSGSNNVSQLSPSGALLGTFSTGSGDCCLAIDASGNVWIANAGAGTVTELNSSGALVGTITVGTTPVPVAVDQSGNVWVGNRGSNSVTELNSSGQTVATYPSINSPQGIAIDGSGNVWIASLNGNTVIELNSAGTVLGTFSSGTFPQAVAIDSSGNIYVTNSGGTVAKFSSLGVRIATYSITGSPVGETFDAGGNLWIATGTGNALAEFNPAAGMVIATYPLATNNATALCIDLNGNVWVANLNGNNLIQVAGVTSGPEFFADKGPVFPYSR